MSSFLGIKQLKSNYILALSLQDMIKLNCVSIVITCSALLLLDSISYLFKHKDVLNYWFDICDFVVANARFF